MSGRERSSNKSEPAGAASPSFRVVLWQQKTEVRFSYLWPLNQTTPSRSQPEIFQQMSYPPAQPERKPDYHAQHARAIQNGEHWYTDAETGFMVFTQLYHQARGFCCQNTCRHCPYLEQTLQHDTPLI